MADTGLPVEIPATIPADAVHRLSDGDVSLLGRMPNASNATFLVRIDEPGSAPPPPDDAGHAPAGPAWGLAIYKPLRGERPLWDFPAGLYQREAAAYRLSAATGLDVIPPTVVRDDAPLGVGSLQWFVNADFTEHYFSLAAERPHLRDQLRAMAVFDVIANNTDRKSGHCLYEQATERVWGIDNGLCFSIEARLRTVIWDFAGDALTPPLQAAAAGVADHVPDDVAALLDDDEVAALQVRAARLADRGTFPHDRTGRGYPWPLV